MCAIEIKGNRSFKSIEYLKTEYEEPIVVYYFSDNNSAIAGTPTPAHSDTKWIYRNNTSDEMLINLILFKKISQTFSNTKKIKPSNNQLLYLFILILGFYVFTKIK